MRCSFESPAVKKQIKTGRSIGLAEAEYSLQNPGWAMERIHVRLIDCPILVGIDAWGRGYHYLSSSKEPPKSKHIKSFA
jgi:hypothetical protein